jgi:hypothetical protein
MALVRAAQIADPRSRRAVFVSTLIAVLLIAGAITFGVTMTIVQTPQIARATAAEKQAVVLGAPAAASDPRAEGLPPLPVSAALPAAETVAPTGTAHPVSTKTTAAVTTAPHGTPKPPAAASGSTVTKPIAKHAPAAAASSDLYRPF